MRKPTDLYYNKGIVKKGKKQMVLDFLIALTELLDEGAIDQFDKMSPDIIEKIKEKMSENA